MAVNGEAWLNDLIDLGDKFEVLPDQRQSSMRGQVVGQTFDLKVGHDGTGIFNAALPQAPCRLHPLGATNSLPTPVSAGLCRKRSRIQG